jgi:hypothetical protein
MLLSFFISANEAPLLDDNLKIGADGLLPRPLLSDSPNFLDFINSDAVLVDKTSLILELLNSFPNRTFFLSRPRRFGKSLLLDTIHNIANGDENVFAGMDIAKKGAGYFWELYPVIRLSFAGFPSNPQHFNNLLLRTLDEIAIQHKLDLPPAETVADIRFIITTKNYEGIDS